MAVAGIKRPKANLADLFPNGTALPMATIMRDVAVSVTQMAINTVAAGYTVQATDEYLRVDASAGARTITLPLSTAMLQQDVVVAKVDSTGNAVTVTASGSEKINGSTTLSLSSQWAKARLLSTGAGWEVIG